MSWGIPGFAGGRALCHTGAVAGRLSAPAGQAFAVITGTASDRTFFAATDLNPQTSCQTHFYQFSLSADGQPSALTALPVRPLPGLPTALAASADGRLVAYSVTKCAGEAAGHIGNGQVSGGIGLINLVTGHVSRHWSYTLSEDYTTDLSMSADGSLLGYSNYLNAESPVGRVLTASAPSGPDERYSRIVIRNPLTTALSSDGSLIYAMIGARGQVLAAYATASRSRCCTAGPPQPSPTRSLVTRQVAMRCYPSLALLAARS